MHDYACLTLGALAALLLTSCGQAPAADTSEPQAPASVATIWPSSLNVFGDGFPKPGDPCRRVGESAATVNYLDDSAVLVGCPGERSENATTALVKATGGQVVGAIQNVTLVSIPQGDANVGMNAAISAATENQDRGSNTK